MVDTIISNAQSSDPYLTTGDSLTITATGALTTSVGVLAEGGNIRVDIALGGSVSGSVFDAIVMFADFLDVAGSTGNLVTNSGTITAQLNGVYMETGGSTIVNRGTIESIGGGDPAVAITDNPYQTAGADTGSVLNNFGTLTGFVGAQLTDDNGVIRNFATGSITGTLAGVTLSGAVGGILVNRGSITGATAIGGNADDLRIVNIGTLTSTGTFAVDVITDGGFFRNEATIAQPVLFGGDGAEFRNLGTISAPVTLVFDSVDDTTGVTFMNRGSGTVTAQLTGSNGPDRIIGAGFTGSAHGNLGDDTLRGGGGDDSFYGGLGADYLQGRGGHDLLDGDGGTNAAGAATAGNDTLIGNAGNDTLLGGAGSDVLNGGKGDDSLTGGSEADTFVMRRVGNGDDQITDFQNGTDVIDISDLALTGYGDITGTPGALSEANGALVIDLSLLGGSGSVTVTGLTLATVDATDFTF